LAATELDLAQWLRRAAALAQSLPNQAALDFDTQVHQALAELPPTETLSTEVQRLVRQRVGQECYRQAMLSYWGGACAVTGLTMASVLRASHAKPWAQCSTDAERLDVFNGLLLSANLDALFDKFLISFDTQGAILINAAIPENDQVLMGLSPELSLRWLAPQHQPYLEYHRHQFQNRADFT
jgi:predicted restriction endonuclease